MMLAATFIMMLGLLTLGFMVLQNKKQNKLIHTSMRKAIDQMTQQNNTLYTKLAERVHQLEVTVSSQQIEINRLLHTVNIQSHIINSVSPRIRFKEIPKNKGGVSS